MLCFLILRLAVQQHQESIATDIIDDKLLDDVFFIVKQCVIRAAGCGNLDGLCAVSNNGWVHQIFSPIVSRNFSTNLSQFEQLKMKTNSLLVLHRISKLLKQSDEPIISNVK